MDTATAVCMETTAPVETAAVLEDTTGGVSLFLPLTFDRSPSPANLWSGAVDLGRIITTNTFFRPLMCVYRLDSCLDLQPAARVPACGVRRAAPRASQAKMRRNQGSSAECCNLE